MYMYQGLKFTTSLYIIDQREGGGKRIELSNITSTVHGCYMYILITYMYIYTDYTYNSCYIQVHNYHILTYSNISMILAMPLSLMMNKNI